MSDDTPSAREPQAPDADAPARAWPVPALVVATVFAALFAWFEYQAIGNLLNVPAAYDAFGLDDRVPWAVLVTGAALPFVFFVAAAWSGVRRTLTQRVLLFATGLAATAATSFALYAVSLYLLSRA